MKNNYYIKKPKRNFIAFLVLFCGLFANTAMAQDTFTWNGSTSNDWATAANWTKTGTAGTDTYPGQTNGRVLDLVVISNGGTPIVAANANPYGMSKLTITNATGPVSGSTLTINFGAALTVTNATTTVVTLNGGNIVNSGTLNVTSTNAGAGANIGITCGTPTVVPSSPTEYSYSGSGALNINISASTIANSAAISVTSLNANTTYKVLFDGATTFSLGSTASSFAVRNNGGASASPLIIGGAGFTLGTVGSPVTGGLIGVGQQSTVTVNAGTTLTLNSAAGNLSPGIVVGNSAVPAVTFTNKGTINILGASSRSGLLFTTFLASATASVFNVSNEGTIYVKLNISTAGNAPLATGNGGSTNTTTTPINLTNTGTGTLSFINTSATVGTGAAIYGLVASQSPPVTLTNNGTINLEGSSYSYGNKFTIVNNSIINTNSELRSFAAVTNNAGGSINFAKTAATATSRQVTFNGLQTTDVSGAIGNTYFDGTNSYVVVNQKFASGTTLLANVLSSATIPTSGTLTLTGGTGGTTPLTFTSVSVPALNGALTTATTNSGTINTDTGSNLNIISGVSAASTGTIEPGGASGKGIADFNNASTLAIKSKLKLQVSGSATAGVDYDQVINSAVGGGFDISAATLDVTGIYTPSGYTAIDVVTTNATGTLTGSFASVVGLGSGWSVIYTNGTAGKVQLVYGTSWTGGALSSDWTNASNWNNGVPTPSSDIVIAAAGNQPIIASNVSIKSLTLNTSTSLTITSGFNLTVAGAIANSGTMTIENNANLIQGGTTNTNTGNIIVNRNSNALSRLDYTIWSSPVASQNLLAFSPATLPTRFYNYNEMTNLYNAVPSPSTTNFATAAGYLIRMPDNAVTAPSTQTFVGVFTGVPNNGDITTAMTYQDATHGYNMVGNPYPSTIDAQAFITSNAANIESSLYFWRKTNGATSSAYAVYNSLGSTATASSDVPNGTIQVGQGFFVKAKSGATTVSFTNAMRVANNQNQIFRTKQVVSPDRVWLNLTNTTGAFSQALVGYKDDATTGVDAYDAKYINDSAIALTSNINNEEYTIQGRPTFDATDVVALNFKTDAAGDYSIALDHFDGVFAAGQDVYLVDSKTGTETNLKTAGYTFTATTGTDNARFALKYQKTLKVAAPAINENTVRVYKNDGTLYVNSGAVAMSNIKVFDMQGRLIAEQKNGKATTAVFSNLKATHQVLIVKITGEDNNVVTKKVVN